MYAQKKRKTEKKKDVGKGFNNSNQVRYNEKGRKDKIPTNPRKSSVRDLNQYDEKRNYGRDEEEATRQEEEQGEDRALNRVPLKNKVEQDLLYHIEENWMEIKLVEAIKSYNLNHLEEAIKAYEDMRETRQGSEELDEDELYSKACRIYDRSMACRKELREAMKKKNPDKKQLVEIIRRTIKQRVHIYVTQDLYKAQSRLEQIREKERIKLPELNRKIICELKAYAHPQPVVHRVLVATFLLLRVDEGKTSVWSNCQKLLVPGGKDGMLRRLQLVNRNNVHKDIIDRVRYLMKYITLEQVYKASSGAGTFYVWNKGITGDDPNDDTYEDETEETTDDDDDEEQPYNNDDVDAESSLTSLHNITRERDERLEKEKEREKEERHERKYRHLIIAHQQRIFQEQEHEEALKARRGERQAARVHYSPFSYL